jgi:short subunit fatty acids transporter
VLSSRIESTRRRAAACSACLALCLAFACFAAPAAFCAGLSGSGTLNELTEGEPETKTTATTSTTAVPVETTNSHTVILLGIGAAALLLSGIVFVIARDARRVTPAGDLDVIERESAHEQAVRLRKRRAKAKAARRQRKRNR